MPNNKNMLDDMNFEQHLDAMGDDQLALLKFVARQQFSMSTLCPLHDKRLRKLEDRTKKEISAVGGIGVFIGAIIAGIIDYFMRRS